MSRSCPVAADCSIHLPAAACIPTISSATATWPGSHSGCASAPPSGSSPSVLLLPSFAASTWLRSKRTSSAAPVRARACVGARAGTWARGTSLVLPRQPISTPCHVRYMLRASEPMLWVHLRSAESSVWGQYGDKAPCQCDSMSVCAFGAFAGGWGASRTYAPTQGCHELSLHAELSPGSLLQGAIPMLAASLAGQTDSAHAQLCSLSSGSCPAMCTCSNGIVDCRGKGLTAIPANLPETMTEM